MCLQISQRRATIFLFNSRPSVSGSWKQAEAERRGTAAGATGEEFSSQGSCCLPLGRKSTRSSFGNRDESINHQGPSINQWGLSILAGARLRPPREAIFGRNMSGKWAFNIIDLSTCAECKIDGARRLHVDTRRNGDTRHVRCLHVKQSAAAVHVRLVFVPGATRSNRVLRGAVLSGRGCGVASA